MKLFLISSPAFPSQEKRVLGIQRSAEIKGDLLARDPSNIYIDIIIHYRRSISGLL